MTNLDHGKEERERGGERTGRETFLEERKDRIKHITEHVISDYFSYKRKKIVE
jgi:hypothetical protein